MNLAAKLNTAYEVFSQVRDNYGSYGSSCFELGVPDTALREMPTLGLAVAIVESIDEEAIGHLAMLGIAHNSTIVGGSLMVARSVYTSFLNGNYSPKSEDLRGLTADNVEQLYRICKTAKNIVEHNLF